MDIKCLVILNCFCVSVFCFHPSVEENLPYGLCANAKCSEPIGKGETTLQYASPDNQYISVRAGENVVIYVKDYGPKKDHFGIIVRGKRGYISKRFIKETATYTKDLVPAIVEFRNLPESNSFLDTSHKQSSHVETVPHTVYPNQVNPQDLNSKIIDSKSGILDISNIPSETSTNQKSAQSFPPHVESSQVMQPMLHSSHFTESRDVLSSKTLADRSVVESLYSSPVPEIQQPSLSNDYRIHPSFSSSGISNDAVNTIAEQHSDRFETPVYSSSITMQPQSNILHSYSESHVMQESFSVFLQESSEILDEDMSKTYSMLKDRGVDNTDLYQSAHEPKILPNENKIDLQKSDFSLSSQSYFSDSHHTADVSDLIAKELNSRMENIPMDTFQSVPESSFYMSDNLIGGTVNTESLAHNQMHSSSSYQASGILSNKGLDSSVGLVEEVFHPSLSDISVKTKRKSAIVDKVEKIIKTVLEADDESFQSNEEIKISQTMYDNAYNIRTSAPESSTLFLDSPESVASPFSDNTGAFQQTSQNSINSNSESSFSFQHSQVDSFQFGENSGIKDSDSSESFIGTTESLEISKTTVIESSSEYDESLLNDEENELEDSEMLDNGDEFVKQSVASDELGHDSDNPDIIEDLLKPENLNSSNEDLKIDTFSKNSSYRESRHEANLLEKPDVFVRESTNAYQTRNLKGEDITQDETQFDSEITEENTFGPLNSLKGFLDSVISWLPEPLYSMLIDLHSKGMSPRVPVFTFICGTLIAFLITTVFFIKERSKESALNAQLASLEKKLYNMTATNLALEEKLEITVDELKSTKESLIMERNANEEIKNELEKYTEGIKTLKYDLASSVKEIKSLQTLKEEHLCLIEEYEKEKAVYLDQISDFAEKIKTLEDTKASLSDQLVESENKVKELTEEKLEYDQLTDEYKEKLVQFEQNCNQLLQEAEVWNIRVNELTSKLSEEESMKEELLSTLKDKDEKLESLELVVATFVNIDEKDLSEEEMEQLKKEKVEQYTNSSTLLSKLNKKEDENKVLIQKLSEEQNKLLEMEVELLDAQSEIDKLKVNYNQALQDKAEAQTKLEVLSNYFKDKEIQLQKQLGAQEAVRQKNEEDVNSAERRICLIEQENSSYKYQVASMKQEMEETERNLKSQIAVQEKKAHENWIAARAAERKLEDMKQEVTQLHQRLTLLERERENWASTSRDGIVKPVPKRMPLEMDESGNHDAGISDVQQSMFHPPPLHHERLPPPFLLPFDRPLPPLFPPPPPYLPPMERPFRPWHMPPNPGSEFRTTPPDFAAGRESTPPRGRHSAVIDGDGAHASSPLTTDTRDSRNSTPPHLLPNFHDLPPQPGRQFFPPPPLGPPRLPLHHGLRRDPGPVSKRADGTSDLSSRSQQLSSQEQWPQHNSRV